MTTPTPDFVVFVFDTDCIPGEITRRIKCAEMLAAFQAAYATCRQGRVVIAGKPTMRKGGVFAVIVPDKDEATLLRAVDAAAHRMNSLPIENSLWVVRLGDHDAQVRTLETARAICSAGVHHGRTH